MSLNKAYKSIEIYQIMFIEKYRPKSFKDVKGQEKIIPRLKAFIENKNMPFSPTSLGDTYTSGSARYFTMYQPQKSIKTEPKSDTTHLSQPGIQRSLKLDPSSSSGIS